MSIKLTPMTLLYLLTAFLALGVISFGAYTRLTDSGLGCPDWPGCYGQLWITSALPESAHVGKAWTEMVHRYLAGTLGFFLSFCLIDSFRIKGTRRSRLLPVGILSLLVFQALLGLWTVTLKLEPLVVLAHLLGGMSLLGLFWWLFLNKLDIRLSVFQDIQSAFSLRKLSLIGLGFLLLQITLGGLTSAHYAALVCPGFPNCYPGYSITNEFMHDTHLQMTLHMLHRFGALITVLMLGYLAIQTYRKMPLRFFRMLSIGLIMTLCGQITLGLINVLAVLPLSIAVAHNTVSALLLVLLTTLIFTLRLKPI